LHPALIRLKLMVLYSDVVNLLSGVVQGSGVGPLMFLLYINELINRLDKLGITVKVFADDVKLYLEIMKDVDILQLQCALDSLQRWADQWQLSISVNVCCVLSIGNFRIPVSLNIDNRVLTQVTQNRDLGVTVTNNLSPSTHIHAIVSRAHGRALAIHRCFLSRDISLLIRAYKVYVRPLLEHNCVVWSPASIGDVEEIERVQRNFTKRLKGLHNYSYIERLKRLNLDSLELHAPVACRSYMVLQNNL